MLGKPETIDSSKLTLRTVDDAFDRLEYANRLARATNAYNYKEATRYYKAIQPSFFGLQNQIGTNALSFSRGELPQDTINSIGRAAAQRGIQAGFGYGSQGGKSGALANLNLRNLGLTSLDLTKYGSQLGMQVNSQAKALLPNMVSPIDFTFGPQQQLAMEQYNLNNLNDVARYNNHLQNQAAMQNTSLANSSREQSAKAQFQGDIGQAEAIQAMGQQVGGTISSFGTNGLFGSQQMPQMYQVGGNYYQSRSGGGMEAIPRAQLA